MTARCRVGLKGAVRWALISTLLLLLLFVSGCNCSGEPPLARLDAKEGAVERDFAAKVREWQPAEIGAEFEVGDALQTSVAASAELSLDDGTAVRLDPETLLRFMATAPDSDEVGFDVETGQAEFRVKDTPLNVRTHAGTATLKPRSVLRLSREADGTRFEIRVGGARFKNNAGQVEEVGAGYAFVVEVGAATFKPFPIEDDSEDKASDESLDEAEESGGGSIAAVVSGKGVALQDGEEWVPLEAGERPLDAGSRLKLSGGGGTVSVARGKESAVLGGSGTFVVGAAPGVLVQANGGELTLQGDGQMRVQVPGGVIVAEPGARAQVRSKGKEGTEVTVQEKAVQLEGKEGTERLEVGQSGILSPAGAVEVEGRGLSYADVTINVGESVVIHDPKPPTAVRFVFAEVCPNGGTVRLRRGKKLDGTAGGAKQASLPIRNGRVDYELACSGGPTPSFEKRGSITVLGDAGTRAVPATAPSTSVQADGRSYTVLYQNLLPQISIQWASAPKSGPYTLHHSVGGASRTYTASSPSYSFKSGRLREGRHVLYFQAGGKVSRRTTVNIRFDNAAPKASLRVPVTSGVGQGESLDVSGTALPGWDVEIGGEKLKQDVQGRFSAPATMPTGQRALEVRLTHPTRGTHIYVRRAKEP